MKQVNPLTNQPYTKGDVRADGKIFVKYKDYVKKDGFNRMVFVGESALMKQKETAKVRRESRKKHQNELKIHYYTPSSKAALLFRKCKQRSEKHGLAFDLTKEWLEAKLNHGICDISGEPFKFDKLEDHIRFNPYSPSIDRIDCLKGYTQDNCRIVLTCINFAMNQWGLDLYIEIAKKVIQNNR